MQQDVELFLDSAKLDEVRAAHETGRLGGLTINPTLALKAIGPDGDYAQHVGRIYEIVGDKCHKSYQVIGKISEDMLRAAYNLIEAFGGYGGLGIKVPVLTANPKEKHLTREGLRAMRELSNEGVLVNATVVQTVPQIILAAYSGAGFISPFLGRTDDRIQEDMRGLIAGTDFQKSDYFPAQGVFTYTDEFGYLSGVDMMSKGVYALHLLKRMGVNHHARMLAASIRNLTQAQEAYLRCADIITSPFDVFMSIAQKDFEWPLRTPSAHSSITDDVIEKWIKTYEKGTDKEIYELLHHPKTVQGFELFQTDGEKLRSFMELAYRN